MPELRDYQVTDLAFHIANPKSLNLSDPGTGKTPTACVLMYWWWARKQRKTVWAMPKSLMEKNREELLRFTDFGPDDIVILETDHAPLTKSWQGPVVNRLKKVKIQTGKLGPDGKPVMATIQVPEPAKDLIAAAASAKVFICTFAFLRLHYERLLKTIPDIRFFGIDEVHMGYGQSGSAQTNSFYHVAAHCEGLLGMTGTLIDGRLDSAFPVIHAIEPRYYGGMSGFIHEHAVWVNDYGRVEAWKNEQKLIDILARHAVRHSFEEVYGDQPVSFETVTVDMFDAQRLAYDLFHDQAMLELEDGRVLDGTLPGVAVIRATQIMAHPETMGLAKNEITAKDNKLMEYANEGRPMLVFSASQPEQERCVTRLEGAARAAIDRDFRNGKLDAIVASGPTAAVGWNWERCDHVVGASWDYKDVNFTQAYSRANRGTRTTTLRVTTLAYRKSIDQRKLNILSAKSELANRVDPTRRVLSF